MAISEGVHTRLMRAQQRILQRFRERVIIQESFVDFLKRIETRAPIQMDASI